jgi:hypothetical protein
MVPDIDMKISELCLAREHNHTSILNPLSETARLLPDDHNTSFAV